MKREGKVKVAAENAAEQGQVVICIRDIMRFVDALELRRSLNKVNGHALLVAMTPCLVDSIAERMLGDVPHLVLHPPFDTLRVELAVQQLSGEGSGPLLLVEVACPEDAARVRQAVAAAARCLFTASADLRLACPPAPCATKRFATTRQHQAAAA
ncbi:MAG: hypothetical protein QHJ34_03920 [bacterium]|jgi:hypothetical protein|nr:hypothetical protein [candidate division KSB1 bacterium]MDH7559363.1 hypothetical protein [bacterium]